jgi:uncharacterized protein YhjY with autotransporter beta-barrel domain
MICSELLRPWLAARGESQILKGFVTGLNFTHAANAGYEYGLYRLRKNSIKVMKRQGTTLVVP